MLSCCRYVPIKIFTLRGWDGSATLRRERLSAAVSLAYTDVSNHLLSKYKCMAYMGADKSTVTKVKYGITQS